VKLVITLPCHNDDKYIEEAVDTVRSSTEQIGDNYIIAIAEDGSTDNSAEISQRLASQYDNVVHIHADEKLGRGKALMNTWRKVEGDIYAYLDCDLATDMRAYPPLINYIKKGYDLSTGSRYLKNSQCERPLLRRLTSIMYNSIIRIIFKDGIYDHQCGFKSFSKRMIKFLLKNYESDSWFWDTEAIVVAYKNGFKIKEFPVTWKEKRRTRTPIKRLFNDLWIHGKGLINLFITVYL
jgi:glycosyltransferase involved in cell wall biosynthesis